MPTRSTGMDYYTVKLVESVRTERGYRQRAILTEFMG